MVLGTGDALLLYSRDRGGGTRKFTSERGCFLREGFADPILCHNGERVAKWEMIKSEIQGEQAWGG